MSSSMRQVQLDYLKAVCTTGEPQIQAREGPQTQMLFTIMATQHPVWNLTSVPNEQQCPEAVRSGVKIAIETIRSKIRLFSLLARGSNHAEAEQALLKLLDTTTVTLTGQLGCFCLHSSNHRGISFCLLVPAPVRMRSADHNVQ